MKIKYTRNSRRLKETLNIVNELLNNDDFFTAIKECKSFDNSNLSAKEISDLISNYPIVVSVKTYWNILGFANAKVDSGKQIRVNIAKHKGSLKTRVNTLMHEYVHCVDFGTKEQGQNLRFTHYDNSNDNGEEDNTAPWKIASLTKQLI